MSERYVLVGYGDDVRYCEMAVNLILSVKVLDVDDRGIFYYKPCWLQGMIRNRHVREWARKKHVGADDDTLRVLVNILLQVRIEFDLSAG